MLAWHAARGRTHAALIARGSRGIQLPIARPSHQRARHGVESSPDVGDTIERGRGLGDREIERTPPAEHALDPDPSAVGFYDASGDGKAQSRAETAAARGRLPEPVEGVRQVPLGDAAASVRDPEHDVVVSRRRADRYATAGASELHRVADQVLEYLEQPVAISEDVRNPTLEVDADLQPGIVR